MRRGFAISFVPEYSVRRAAQAVRLDVQSAKRQRSSDYSRKISFFRKGQSQVNERHLYCSQEHMYSHLSGERSEPVKPQVLQAARKDTMKKHGKEWIACQKSG